MARKSILVLLAILLLGFFLRFYRVWEMPMYGDELTMVYDTYSISKTGMDATGERFPLTFRMGAGRPAGYVYFSLPFVYAFGPTVLGVRSLSILSGLGIIILMYFLGRKLFNEKVGIIASAFAAVSPWEIYLSRAGFEAHFALLLALLGAVLFLHKKYLWWGVAWGVAALTYLTFRMTLPFLFLVLAWFVGYKKLLSEKVFVASLIVLAAFAFLVARESLKTGSNQRFFGENVFAIQSVKEGIIQKVNYERTISNLPENIKPIFFNRGIEYGRLVFENYIKNLSPNFLILKGDENPRHNPGEMGMLYVVDLLLLLIGLAFLWKDRKKEFYLLLKWILITPLATMFFPEAHGLRNGLMLPPVLLLSAYGLTKISKSYVYVATLFIATQLIFVLVRVYTVAPEKFASFWSAEARAASIDAVSRSQKGEKVILSTREIGDIEYAYEIYAKVDPKTVISQYGRFPKNFGNVTIVNH